MKKFHSKVLILVLMWSAVAVNATAAAALQDTIAQICRSFAPQKPKDSVEKDENHIYEWVQVKPSFPGGEEARMKWLQENIKYPSTCANLRGTVNVKFVVEKDGSISNVELIKSVHPMLDNEAIRLAESMPKWIPAKHNDKVVRCYFTQPIKFELKQDTVSQSQDNVEDEKMVFVNPLIKPLFPGGEEARLKWLSDNMVYPADAVKSNIEGVVTVSFVVEKDGSITSVKVIKGVHPLLDQEAVRVTESMPKWEPGKMSGKVTRSYMMQPIRFELKQNNKSKIVRKNEKISR